MIDWKHPAPGPAALVFTALLALPLALPTSLAAQERVPLPRWSGPVAVTPGSYPLMADDHMQIPVGLAARGYLEEEFFLSGEANVYEWAEGEPGGVRVRARNAPYTTRILIRRPADPAVSSGTAWVELGNNARVYDWGFTWSLSWEHLIGSGDVWVGVTYSPGAIRGLRAFDAGRYAPLSFANPGSEACGAAAVPGTEGGLAPDMLSQLAALLRDPSGPLGVGAAEYVYAVSHGVELPTYVAAVHPRSRLADGRAPYDGFLLHRHNLLASLHECGSAPPAGDARHVIRDAGAPVIRIVSETDVLATLDMRREDSDAPGDRYRLYEVAGAPHADGAFYRQLPALGDQEAAGTRPFLTYWPFASQCEPEIPIQELGVMRYVTDAALRNLDAWARGGEAPPRAARIEVSGGEDRDILRDEFGNALGGVRSPDLDAPRARYFTSAGGPGGCRNLGYSEPFGWSRLEDIYGSFGGWAERVRISVESLLDRGWLTPADARRILADRFEP